MEKRGIVCLWKSLEARGWETYEKSKNGPKKKLPVDRALDSGGWTYCGGLAAVVTW